MQVNRIQTNAYHRLSMEENQKKASQIAIIQQQKGQISGYGAGARNAQDGKSVLNTADAAMGSINDYLLGIRDLSVKASNSALLSDDEKKAIQQQIDQYKPVSYTHLEIKKIRASERRGGYDDGWNAGRIEGEAAGKIAGRIEGEAAGKIAGRIEGEAAGKIAGRIEGEAAGKIAGKKEVLLEILEEKGKVTGLLKKKIHDQNDMTILKSWIQKACMIDSIEEFENDIGSM